MKAADFAASHNVDKNAVFQYIRRHPEMFEGHTSIENKSMVLDEVAIDLLSVKYPLPVELVADDEAREQLQVAMKRVDFLQQRIDQYQQQIIDLLKRISQAETQQFLLEDREKQLQDMKTDREHTTSELLQARLAQQEAEEKLRRMKSRTLWQRIRNVDV